MEVCNGMDDDCDGKIDEKACDDGNPCTNDTCDINAGKCASTVVTNGTPCDADGSVCTVADNCVIGVCTVGKVKDCDDGDPCTQDACDVATGCTQTMDAGAPCSDDNPCTIGDICGAEGCKPGKSKACPTTDDCTLSKCSLVDGKCTFVESPVGSPCDDGNACTGNDICTLGICMGQVVDCDDGNACTTEGCVLGTGCVSKTMTVGTCDDGDVCTVNDGCVAGACTGVGYSCDDNVACTVDSCDSKKGCLHAQLAGGCDDGDPCTEGDTCDNGLCKAGVLVCECKTAADCVDDGDLCNGVPTCDTTKVPYACNIDSKTIVVCDTQSDGACAVTVCLAKDGTCAKTSKPDGTSCSDDNVCTAGDACSDGSCAPGKASDCDDDNPCTADACDTAKGCVNTPTPNLNIICYAGPDGTQNVGACKAGKQVCDANGKLSGCSDAVVPAPSDLCDGQDDDCDGKTDEDCKPSVVALSQAPLMMNAGGAGKAVQLAAQLGPIGDAKGSKTTLRWSLVALWQQWWN
ncbi:MAG: hypothetical protein H6747_14630 [Deltaproteobacteria bacterium]|nr:hypothetical protein [Deltaproteobacteria bacterium]